ncbi:MAG TPA: XRE family transcriptional regulator [Polyangiaceae bacterium]|nr:XRE family transcriptional regulator [Polyangiaceae bacterium]
MSADEASYLGENIRHCREQRGLSQAQMATQAGIPRATWTHLESGAANPTLAVLIKVANALQVRLEELLTRGQTDVQVTRVEALPVRQRGQLTIRLLLPETLAGLHFERMSFPPGGRANGVPHTAGTREYLTCESGEVELVVAGQAYRLAPGDVVAFRGDQKHHYANVAPGESVAYSVIAFSPIGG